MYRHMFEARGKDSNIDKASSILAGVYQRSKKNEWLPDRELDEIEESLDILVELQNELKQIGKRLTEIGW